MNTQTETKTFKCDACDGKFTEEEFEAAFDMCLPCYYNCECCFERREGCTEKGLCIRCETEMGECQACGKYSYKDEMNKHNDGYYCNDCNPSANCGCELCKTMKEADDEYDGDSSDEEEETDYCNGCDRDVPAVTMFNHDDINLCPECNTKKPELIPEGCECERCVKE